MSSYATLQDAYGISSFGAPVADEMNGDYFDARPVITEAMHNVYGEMEPENMSEVATADVVVEKMENAPPPKSLKRRTTAKRHDENFQNELVSVLHQLPPVQREVLTAAFVGGAVYVLLSLLD